MPSYQPNKWHAKGMSLQILECNMFLLRKASYQTRFLSLVKTKTKMCRARGAKDWFIFPSLYFTLPFFCCSKRWAAPIGHLSSFLSSQAWLLAYLRYGSTLEPQLPQFNPNLKDKPYSFMFFFYYDTLQFGQIVVLAAQPEIILSELGCWNP